MVDYASGFFVQQSAVVWNIYNFSNPKLPIGLPPGRRSIRDLIFFENKGMRGPLETNDKFVKRISNGKQIEHKGHLYVVKYGKCLEFTILDEEETKLENEYSLVNFVNLKLAYEGWLIDKYVPKSNNVNKRKNPIAINFIFTEFENWELKKNMMAADYLRKVSID